MRALEKVIAQSYPRAFVLIHRPTGHLDLIPNGASRIFRLSWNRGHFLRNPDKNPFCSVWAERRAMLGGFVQPILRTVAVGRPPPLRMALTVDDAAKGQGALPFFWRGIPPRP